MKKVISSILLMTLSSQVLAQENFLTAGFTWAKESLQQKAIVNFNKSKIKFNGCKQLNYELQILQPINDSLSLESEIVYAKGRISFGVHQQSISLMQFSLIPRYSVTENLDIGAGVMYQSAPEFKTSNGQGFDLPRSRTLLISGRMQGLKPTHSLEFQVSRQDWQPSTEIGGMFESGLTDNKLSVSYQVYY